LKLMNNFNTPKTLIVKKRKKEEKKKF